MEKVIRRIDPKDGLFQSEEIVQVAASGIGETSFTVQKGRGDVYAYSIVVGSASSTEIELMTANITISPNGKSSVTNSSLLKYTKGFFAENRITYNQFIKGASTVNYKIDNSANSKAITVGIILYFSNPNQILEVNSKDVMTFEEAENC